MKLKILQWNVFYKEDPEKIAKEILKLDADIVCAQELMQNLKLPTPVDSAKQIAEYIHYHYIYQVADTWSNRTDKENQGNAIFSKFPVSQHSFQHLQLAKHNPPDPEHEGRVYVEAKFLIGGKYFTVGTTHLSYSSQFQITDHRKKEINNLIHLLKRKENSYIFTGDLNSVPDSYTIEQIQEQTKLKSLGPDFNKKSWTTKPFNYAGFSESKLNWRIDYAFGTSDIVVTNAQIIQTEVSDHLPILVEINF